MGWSCRPSGRAGGERGGRLPRELKERSADEIKRTEGDHEERLDGKCGAKKISIYRTR